MIYYANERVISDMKGVYITSYDLTNRSDGVSKKICSQIDCMRNKGIEIDIMDANSIPKGFRYKVLSMLSRILCTPFIVNELSAILANKIIKSELQYDFIYMRKGYCDSAQIESFRKIKSKVPNVKILVEIPTYPYDNEFSGRRKIIAIPRDKKFRAQYSIYVDRIVTYSDDKTIFGTKTINVHNGVDYRKNAARKNIPHEGVNLLAVAFFDSWHGYDRLIKGMANDAETVRANNIVLHLVGSGNVVEEYKRIVTDNKLEDNVKFYGKLHGADLDAVYNIADIGVDTLGRHRVGVHYNSTLKGKEYCAKGLPIISGVKTDLDDLHMDYYKRVPADETPISISEIIEFYHKIYDGRKLEEVINSIRLSSQEWFDFEKAFSPVIDYISESKKENDSDGFKDI